MNYLDEDDYRRFRDTSQLPNYPTISFNISNTKLVIEYTCTRNRLTII